MTTIARHIILAALTAVITACSPEPPLHLFDQQQVDFDLPVIDLDLDVYWDYEMAFGIDYDWQAEWYYGWDDEDRRLFGNLSYEEPNTFCLRRYYTGSEARAPHTSVAATTIEGRTFRGSYNWGFWDILVWNDVQTLDGVQSLVFDEQTTLDSVQASTNESMHSALYHAPRHTRSYYEPEPLFAAYDQGIDINRDLNGFDFDASRNAYVKKLNMVLLPITYIYLTQVILHHNRGRIAAIDGTADLSGMARSTNVNTGHAGDDAIAVSYGMRLKPDCDKQGELVDIVGGRMLTFGMCGQTANSITGEADVTDRYRHYMGVSMQFNNGMDSTFVFDVTRQVRQRYKGGVITVELDMDTVPTPSRPGGSGFNAVVKDVEDGGTHEIEL